MEKVKEVGKKKEKKNGISRKSRRNIRSRRKRKPLGLPTHTAEVQFKTHLSLFLLELSSGMW